MVLHNIILPLIVSRSSNLFALRMIKHIRHALNLVKNHFRDVGLLEKRSSKWPAVEKRFRAAHPTCAACGGANRLQIHHIEPFHLNPALELDENNLITLCMGMCEDHLQIGHCGNFKLYNPNIRADAATILKDPAQRNVVAAMAKKNALPN